MFSLFLSLILNNKACVSSDESYLWVWACAALYQGTLQPRFFFLGAARVNYAEPLAVDI